MERKYNLTTTILGTKVRFCYDTTSFPEIQITEMSEEDKEQVEKMLKKNCCMGELMHFEKGVAFDGWWTTLGTSEDDKETVEREKREYIRKDIRERIDELGIKYPKKYKMETGFIEIYENGVDYHEEHRCSFGRWEELSLMELDEIYDIISRSEKFPTSVILLVKGIKSKVSQQVYEKILEEIDILYSSNRNYYSIEEIAQKYNISPEQLYLENDVKLIQHYFKDIGSIDDWSDDLEHVLDYLQPVIGDEIIEKIANNTLKTFKEIIYYIVYDLNILIKFDTIEAPYPYCETAEGNTYYIEKDKIYIVPSFTQCGVYGEDERKFYKTLDDFIDDYNGASSCREGEYLGLLYDWLCDKV